MPSRKEVAAKKSSPSAKHSAGGGASTKVILTLAVIKKSTGKNGIDKKKLASQAEIGGASTLRKAFAKLKREGFIEVQGDMVSITDAGYASADPAALESVKIPTTNKEKHDSVKEKLNGKQCLLFEKIEDGRPHNKKELCDEMGMTQNSTWRKLMASLVTAGVAEHEGDCIRLTKDMFPIVPRPEE